MKCIADFNLLFWNEELPIYIEEREKPKVIFIHGFNSSKDFIKGLWGLKRNYDIISFDLPGCGPEATFNNPIDVELYNKVTHSVLSEFNIRDVVVVAHSLGALLALSNYDHRKVKSYILLAPFNPFILDDKNPEKLKSMLLPETIEEAKESVSHLVKNPECVSYFNNIDRSASTLLKQIRDKKVIFEGIVTNQITNRDYLNRLIDTYTNKPNVTVVAGDNDFFTPLESVKKTAKLLNAKELIVLENTGHALLYERPKEINDIICKAVES